LSNRSKVTENGAGMLAGDTTSYAIAQVQLGLESLNLKMTG